MDRRDVIVRLKAAEPAIRARGVAALYLYGSYARDNAQPDSDIDILVEFEVDRGSGLQGFMAPYRVLEDHFPGMTLVMGHARRLLRTIDPISSKARYGFSE
ncbi:nucleotidyltransferase family protein [Pararhizobium sp. O133]|uniref:nucleotidyltransferase family protein n=1 Tax=Pararhizobium sp. O133 TaxID=3449278 RepID=UPI003F6888A1